MSEKIKEYSAFWLYYLREHARPLTRGLHYIGSALALVFLGLGILGEPTFYFAVPLAGYGFAWVAHFFVEHNKPATFKYPLWSLYSDWRMFGLFISGRLQTHLDQAGVR
jgi:hypothetical protein